MSPNHPFRFDCRFLLKEPFTNGVSKSMIVMSSFALVIRLEIRIIEIKLASSKILERWLKVKRRLPRNKKPREVKDK